VLLNSDKSEVIYFGTRQRLGVSVLPESVSIAGSTIATTDKLKILGVTLDSSLTFDQHVLNTVRNCNFHLRALRHIRSSLTPDVANMMACSVIGSGIDYCNSLLIGINEQNLDRLQRVQNKAAPILCNASRYATSSALLHSLHWLPVRCRIDFKTAILCFKAVKLGTPPYLKNLFNPYERVRSLRSSCIDLLTVPHTATAFGCRHFAVTGPRIWNGLPHELRQCNTVQCFKSHLKTYHFRHHMDN